MLKNSKKNTKNNGTPTNSKLKHIEFDMSQLKQQNGTNDLKQKSITPTKLSRVSDGQQTETTTTPNNRTSKVTFERRPSEKDEMEVSADNHFKKYQKNVRRQEFSKQNSIDPEIINSYDQKSMTAYFGTLNYFKQVEDLQSPQTRTLNSRILQDSNNQKQDKVVKNSSTNLHTPVKQIKLSPTNTSKSNRNRGGLYQEWNTLQELTKMENKKVTPHKQIERDTPVKQHRSTSKAAQQKIKDFCSQIITLPGGSYSENLQQQNSIGIDLERDKSPNQIFYKNFLQQLDQKNKSRNRFSKNDSSGMSSVLVTPKSLNEQTGDSSFSSNLFSKFLKQQKQAMQNKDQPYITMYKQDFSAKTNFKDLASQEVQIKRKQEESAKKVKQQEMSEKKQKENVFSTDKKNNYICLTEENNNSMGYETPKKFNREFRFNQLKAESNSNISLKDQTSSSSQTNNLSEYYINKSYQKINNQSTITRPNSFGINSIKTHKITLHS